MASVEAATVRGLRLRYGDAEPATRRRGIPPVLCGDAHLLPVVLCASSGIALVSITLERFLMFDFCAEPQRGCADSAGVAAGWMRWIGATSIACNALSMPILGPTSDALRAASPSAGARAPVLALQLIGSSLNALVLLLQAAYGLPRPLQLFGAALSGLLGGEINAVIACVYSVRSDAFGEGPEASRQRPAAFLRLQATLMLSSAVGAMIASTLLRGDGVPPLLR